MMTLLAFIHDAAERCKEDATELPPYDAALIRSALQMFDPRLFRRLNDAEELTGTHLYAYFANEALPAELIAER